MSETKHNYVERAYGRLRQMIIEHEIKPNEQLFITALSLSLNVSATPIREALNRLLNERLVVKGHNRGFFVREMREQEQRELIILREVLLVWAVRFYLSRPDAVMYDFIQQERTVWSCLDRTISQQKNKLIEVDKGLFSLIFEQVAHDELKRIYQNCMARCGYVWYTFIGHEQQLAYYHQHYLRLMDALWRQDVGLCEQLIQAGSQKCLGHQHITLLCFNGGVGATP
ncbi:MAG: GntR family transcriptional regulator [Neisseriaceae bacterium]|nr:GntR family transcriptional regulator [Neisseriaceae bacterium]MBP6862426.1 GntR family transcriptional regulator [Neisseriaceae bacterium]